MNSKDYRILPLGVLSPRPGEEWTGDGLLSSIGKIPDHLREPIARYLEGCSVFLAWMEQTTEILGGKFEVPGGSAVYSDGEFYWRGDSAEYVRHYGVWIPPEAENSMRLHNREPFKWDEKDPVYLEIYSTLESYWGVSEVTSYWSPA